MSTSTLSLKPPENFDFAKLDTWSKWKKQFASASGLYCLGEEANDVLSSTNIMSIDRNKYVSVVEIKARRIFLRA